MGAEGKSRHDGERQIEILLAFLREEDGSLKGLHISEWFALCRQLKEHGLLAVSTPRLRRFAPRIVAKKVDAWDAHHRARMAQRASALAAFDGEARRQSLHYLVIKGMALSKKVFGDELARQSGDIDILVDADDLPKADYVARATGWLQPGEARIARRLHDEGALDAEALERLASPYSLRSNGFLPHMTNYYLIQPDGAVDTLEIHDRFHCLSADQVRSLLWDADTVELCGNGYFTCSEEAAFVLSALSLHEDAETARANTSTRGTMGLKACVDLHRQLSALSDEGAQRVQKMIENLGVRREVMAVLGDVVEVFPSDRNASEKLGTAIPSAWSMSYLERLLNPRKRAENGTARSAYALERLSRSKEARAFPSAAAGWRALPATGGVGEARFSFLCRPDVGMESGSGSLCLAWRLPPEFVGAVDDLVFQAVVFCSSASDRAQGAASGTGGRGGTDAGPCAISLRVNVFRGEGTWEARVQSLAPDSIDGHANKLPRGDAASAWSRRKDDGSLIVATKIDVPDAALVLAGVYEHLYGQLYRRCAGWDIVEEVDRLMANVPMASPYAEYLPELRQATLFRDIDDEGIIALLDALKPSICDGPLKPPADGSPHKAFRMVLRTDPPKKAAPRRFPYEMQERCEPGMLMGEVLVLTRKEEFIKPTPLSIKPPLPKRPGKMKTLEFTPAMLIASCQGKAAEAQRIMLRNMMGMLAQKVVDVRRDLYLERSGYDIYAPNNMVKSVSDDRAVEDVAELK